MAYDLKSESEVKEYLEKLGIEYRFGCFSEKKPEVCHLLGDYLEAIKKDFEKAGRVYKNNCEEYKYAKSCYKYGKYLLVGRGQGKENFKESYKYFEKGCQLGEADSCLHQGLMLVSNNKKIDVPLDIAKGLKCLETACEGNNANACYYLSGMYIAGVLKDQKKPKTAVDESSTKKPSVDYQIAKDMSKAFTYALKGCDLGNMYSCANVSQMYAKGDGVKKSTELSDKYKKIALDMQEQTLEENKTLTFQEGLGPV